MRPIASASEAKEEVFEEPEAVDMDAIGDSVEKGKAEEDGGEQGGEEKSSE